MPHLRLIRPHHFTPCHAIPHHTTSRCITSHLTPHHTPPCFFTCCSLPSLPLPPPPCQIEYLVEGRLPEDLSVGLVFSNLELERLKRRIDVRGAGWGGTLVCTGGGPAGGTGAVSCCAVPFHAVLCHVPWAPVPVSCTSAPCTVLTLCCTLYPCAALPVSP